MHFRHGFLDGMQIVPFYSTNPFHRCHMTAIRSQNWHETRIDRKVLEGTRLFVLFRNPNKSRPGKKKRYKYADKNHSLFSSPGRYTYLHYSASTATTFGASKLGSCQPHVHAKEGQQGLVGPSLGGNLGRDTLPVDV
jgi:hypothetical protein